MSMNIRGSAASRDQGEKRTHSFRKTEKILQCSYNKNVPPFYTIKPSGKKKKRPPKYYVLSIHTFTFLHI